MILDTLRKISGLQIIDDEIEKAAAYCKPYIEEQYPDIRKTSSAQIISAFGKAAKMQNKDEAREVVQACLHDQARKMGVTAFSIKPLGVY